ncbi:tripartite tricarboxylate transporter substrate binding protein [Bosea sp. BK604]|uniref:Bug family tripartite tricarboxylate transporter substrate binding protein n=1 Tax=Bosea sp. BK604 TaxID=2512180 RepID=UPI00104ED3BC|nr:tripartite tricarboxylate transporter substrate binding protein [Bosea sp. BK604]TCR67145.1 tripartite-type tricarboxylate transporter receptor subunit TctC [Bosea sp. BK604]
MRRIGLICAAVALALGAADLAVAQTYPSNAIQLVIPYPPGGSEALGRKIAATMSKNIGQPIVINNIAGASTQIASLKIKEAKPDGYTMYVSSPPEFATGPAFYANLAFDPLKDFTLVSYHAEAPYLLLISAKLPVKTYDEFLAYLKKNPNDVRFGSYGPLSQVDILARRFKKDTGINFDIVPYSGGSPAFNALMAGEIQAVFATPIPTRGFITDNRMIPVAVTTEKRSKLFPNVPTLKEVGLPIVDSASYGIVGPANLPANIVAFWGREWTRAMNDPETKAFIEDMGVEIVASSPEQFRTWLVDNTKLWSRLATELGIDKKK